MQESEGFNGLSASALFYVIAEGTEKSAEALYYLLRRRLSRALKEVYALHGFGLDDDYEDTIDDFFLYLYDGNQDGQQPFCILKNIQNKRAFFGWIVSTYRNFLLNKAKEEIRRRELISHAHSACEMEDDTLREEQMVHFVASAVAYADQKFVPKKRFILYRMLLSFLNHRKAIPQESMARVLEMHPVTYRVCTKRQKDRLLEFILLQESGEKIILDEAHLKMRDRIVGSFNKLYELLLEYYDHTLDQLPKAVEIQSLRKEYARRTGTMMHEDYAYGFRYVTEVKTFYEALKS